MGALCLVLEQDMKANLKTEKSMAKDSIIMKMGTFMMANGNMIEDMDRELLNIDQKVNLIKVNGLKVREMVTELLNLLLEMNMLENGNKDISMVVENSNMQVGLNL